MYWIMAIVAKIRIISLPLYLLICNPVFHPYECASVGRSAPIISSIAGVGIRSVESTASTVHTTRRNVHEDHNEKLCDDVLTADEIKLPDHLEGVRIERDGHLNKSFRKEVILGKRDTMEGARQGNPDKLITRIFRKADSNKDRHLSTEELASWITAKVNEHFEQAIKGNFHIFMAIDKDHNGLVTWEEYHSRYLLDQGYNCKYVKNHSENHKDMTRQMREEILLDRAAFLESLHTNEEGLNIDEFLSFRHPEHSHATLLNMVQDIFDKLDENGDDVLSADEFASLRQGDVVKSALRMPDEMWKREREREFVDVIDVNKDGQVTRQELVTYSDPKNPSHALMEAKSLIDGADANRDGKLSLAEVLANKDLFFGSKMVDIARKFHDEF